jgi:hypothetical protein
MHHPLIRFPSSLCCVPGVHPGDSSRQHTALPAGSCHESRCPLDPSPSQIDQVGASNSTSCQSQQPQGGTSGASPVTSSKTQLGKAGASPSHSISSNMPGMGTQYLLLVKGIFEMTPWG